jgi:large subunit ribosomal protein L29e
LARPRLAAHSPRFASPRQPPRQLGLASPRPAPRRAADKNHANGIKKPKRQRYLSTDGVDPKFLRNQRFAKKVTLKLQEAWMAFVAEQEKKPAFASWKAAAEKAKRKGHLNLAYASEVRQKDAAAYKKWEAAWLEAHKA